MADYFYVVDSFLGDPKYRTELIRVESRIAALGLQGRTDKMTILKNIVDTTEDAVKRGATTVVVIGNDQTVTKILPVIIAHNVTLGIIPMGPEQTIAQAFGLPDGLAACDALSRRIIAKVDVGQANTHFFLLQLTAPAPSHITCDGTYTVTSTDPGGSLQITNLRSDLGVGHPDDGRLELVVQPGQTKGWWGKRQHFTGASVFPIRKAKIQASAEAGQLLLDGQTVIKAPITVEVKPRKLAVIVGPNRRF